MSSGWTALVLCLILGPRLGFGKEPMPPHSMVLCMVGTGMLYVGWFGFNAGSALGADAIASNAFTTTMLAAATGGFVWAVMEWFTKGHPSVLGFCSGDRCGSGCGYSRLRIRHPWRSHGHRRRCWNYPLPRGDLPEEGHRIRRCARHIWCPRSWRDFGSPAHRAARERKGQPRHRRRSRTGFSSTNARRSLSRSSSRLLQRPSSLSSSRRPLGCVRALNRRLKGSI